MRVTKFTDGFNKVIQQRITKHSFNKIGIPKKESLLSIIGKCWFGRTIQAIQFMMKDFKTVEAHIFAGDLINRIMTVLDGMPVCQMTIMAICY